MDKNLKVTVLQPKNNKNPEEKITEIEEYVERLNTDDIDILCLPELPIYGFNYELLSKLSVDEIKEKKQFFKDIASNNDMYIITGLIEKTKGGCYDSAYIFNRSGKEIFKYRKTHLWSKERKFFKPGNSIEVAEIDGWKIGLGICADLGFPEFSRTLTLKGAEVLFFPSAWSEPYGELWNLMNKARAAENQVYLISPNLIGSGNNYCGLSISVNPRGEIMKQLKNSENYFSIFAKKELLKERREEIPWLEQRRPLIYDIS
ncbi:MAG: carbon-nitrogen hydrolase family protein [Thermoplasmata archaeon]